jgi:hypothetical protein
MLFPQHSGEALQVNDAVEVPAEPGVYFWRRILRFDRYRLRDGDSVEHWIRRKAEAPLALLPSLRIDADPDATKVGVRSNFFLIREARIGAARLEGKEILPTGVAERQAFLSQVEDLLACFGPVLYVGSSENLQRRTREHLGGQTALADRLKECDLGFGDVALSYVVLDSRSDDYRFKLEFLMTHLSGAPLTKKAGA